MTSDEMTEAPGRSDIPQSRSVRFAQWLMEREEKREAKESNLEALVRLNVLVSFLTLGLVGGFTAVQTAVSMIPYL